MKPPSQRILTKGYNNLKLIFIEHIPLLLIVFLYLGYAVYLEHIFYNNNNITNLLAVRIKLFNKLSLVMLFSIIIFLIAQFTARLLKDNIPGLYPKWHDIIINYFTIRRLGGCILIYLLFPIVVTVFENLKRLIPLTRPFDWDIALMEFDYTIHFHRHPWLLFSSILQNNLAILLIDRLYIIWFILLHSFTFWLSWSKRRIIRMQFFVCNVLILFIIGNVLATAFSSAGPCYYAKVTGIIQNNPYNTLMDQLYEIDKKESLFALNLQQRLWDNYIYQKENAHENISAMPSVHLAYATLFALTASTVTFYFGLIFWAYVAIIQVGSVILGWHYAIDGYFSIVFTVGLWKLAGFLNHYFWQRLPEALRSQILNSR